LPFPGFPAALLTLRRRYREAYGQLPR